MPVNIAVFGEWKPIELAAFLAWTCLVFNTSYESHMQGGIPKLQVPILQFNRDDLKGLPFTFPDGIIR